MEETTAGQSLNEPVPIRDLRRIEGLKARLISERARLRDNRTIIRRSI